MTANILIVDDLEQNIKVLEAKLLTEYYTVFTANSGASAIELLMKNKIDVILLDIMMPDMDGFETCVKIKSDPETSHIPVVMVTALYDVEDRIKGLEAGADEFLTKPVNDMALFARVKSLSRMKEIIDELKIRNNTKEALGVSVVELQDSFIDDKILIINDDVVQTRNIHKILSKITSNISIIARMDEFKEEDFHDYDIVIISCKLEADDPLRVSAILRSKKNFHNTMLMLLAEDEDMPIVIKGMDLGVNDYFLYPIEENELQARIKTQLKKKKYQDNLRNIIDKTVDLSIKDGLTEIFNRRYFDMHIEQMIKKSKKISRSFSLLMLDIDDFKEVNDKYGHQAGDNVLKTFADNIKNIVRITDLVARYGGEEFTVSLDISINEAMIVAERLRKNIELIDFEIPHNQGSLTKTVSIGVSEYIIGESAHDFINRVDHALYKAKEDGKNKVVLL